MYLEHFQLSSQPFSEHAAVTSLWQDPRMDEGLARLEYLVQCGELGLVTGPSGVGNWERRPGEARIGSTSRSSNGRPGPKERCCSSSTKPICLTGTP
jgi:hypothetical protein